MFCCVCSVALWSLDSCWRSTWALAIIEAIECDIGHFRPAFARSHGHQHDVIRRSGIGRIDLAAARHYLTSEVPAGSMPALLAASAVLALQRLVLPVMHWMDDRRAFGILRPRGGER